MDSRTLCIGSGLGLAICTWIWLQAQHSQPRRSWLSSLWQSHGKGCRRQRCSGADDMDADVETPDHYKDPISLSVIVDPVVLSATGQVYCYSTIREWFKTGNRLCPRTNIEVLDVQLTRLPWLKQQIRDWCEQHSIEIPDSEGEHSTLTKKLKAINPDLPGWIADIRSDSGFKRVQAATHVYDLMRRWEAAEEVVSQEDNLLVRGAVLDDMVWLLRYGDPYLQGVAASILSYFCAPDEVQWLAPTAAVPTVGLCLSHNAYTAQAATRLLYNLVRAGASARRAVHAAGGVQGLLKVVNADRQEFGYSRDRAAACLAVLCKDPEIKAHLQALALRPLKGLLGDAAADRYEIRDAATALLALQCPEEDLVPEYSHEKLFKLFWCSRAWLEGNVDEPDVGYTEDEQRLRTNIEFWQANAGTLFHQLLARDLVLHEAGAAGGQDDHEHEDDD